MIPAHTKASLDRYVNHRLLPGGFLIKVLSNDLFGAVGQADSENRAALADIVQYIYNHVPANAWGNEKRVYDYVSAKMFDAFFDKE